MIAPASHPVWARLITGEVRHRFAVTSAGLVTFNLRQRFSKAPATMPSLIAEARQFFSRYESLCAPDLEKLFR